MRIDGVPYRTIWVDPDDGWSIRIIDQTKLPWALEIVRLTDVAQAAHAIRSMQVRGAPLIGAAAAYGLCLGLRQDPSSVALERDAALLAETRPTAINLRWALERMLTRLRNTPAAERERCRLCGSRRDRGRGRGAERGDRPARTAADRAGGAAGPARERADALQRRMAGDGRLGHRAGADLPGA